MKALKVLVLLLSISAASVLVWNAAREQRPKNVREKGAFTTDELQGSSKSKAIGQNLFGFEPDTVDADDLIESPKSGGIIEHEDISEIVESDKSVPKVTDEEVKRTRDMMMSTSKSGRIMSDDKIREMLEERKKEELKLKTQPYLMHSSKRIGSVLDAKELEKIVEGEKQDSNDLQELLPQEE